eukprot:COSAG04_NODE_2626_length_3837_cov_3.014446_5_plen_246_part_00
MWAGRPPPPPGRLPTAKDPGAPPKRRDALDARQPLVRRRAGDGGPAARRSGLGGLGELGAGWEGPPERPVPTRPGWDAVGLQRRRRRAQHPSGGLPPGLLVSAQFGLVVGQRVVDTRRGHRRRGGPARFDSGAAGGGRGADGPHLQAVFRGRQGHAAPPGLPRDPGPADGGYLLPRRARPRDPATIRQELEGAGGPPLGPVAAVRRGECGLHQHPARSSARCGRQPFAAPGGKSHPRRPRIAAVR